LSRSILNLTYYDMDSINRVHSVVITKQISSRTKNDFANAIKRYLNNPNTYIERLEIDNGVAAGFRDNELVLLKMLLDELKG
jgi:predicted transcriptional regulator